MKFDDTKAEVKMDGLYKNVQSADVCKVLAKHCSSCAYAF